MTLMSNNITFSLVIDPTPLGTPFPLTFLDPDGVGTGWGSQKSSTSGWGRGGGCEINLKRGGDGVGVVKRI